MLCGYRTFILYLKATTSSRNDMLFFRVFCHNSKMIYFVFRLIFYHPSPIFDIFFFFFHVIALFVLSLFSVKDGTSCIMWNGEASSSPSSFFLSHPSCSLDLGRMLYISKPYTNSSIFTNYKRTNNFYFK